MRGRRGYCAGQMDRSARIALASLTLCLGIGAAFFLHHAAEQSEAAYARDDREQLADDETGLRNAYAFLRKGGYRVALETPENAKPPPNSHAWWIFQSGAEWFAEPQARAAEVRRFAESGGTVVIAPAEALTAPADDSEDGAADATADEPKASDKFFAALGLDVHLLAFESPADDDDDGPASDDAADPGTVAADTPQEDTFGYTLPVNGHGPHFDSLTYLQTSWGNFWSGEDLLKGEVRLETDGFPLVVEFTMGKGRVVLVAESTYFENEFLSNTHNLELLEALAKAYGAQGIALLTAR